MTFEEAARGHGGGRREKRETRAKTERERARKGVGWGGMDKAKKIAFRRRGDGEGGLARPVVITCERGRRIDRRV